jgi:Tol biopolymer transport system component
MDEQRLERALRQGPPFATQYVPSAVALDPLAARAVVGPGRLVIAVALAALLLTGLLGGLVAVGVLRDDDGAASNGPIAFARAGSGPPGPDGWVERDIFLHQQGEPARRIVGSGDDNLDQVCPAFAPDGRRLAHGEAEGTFDAGYEHAALVISDLDAAGNATESLRVEVGGAFPPPCAAWSADGRRVAFGAPATDPVNPQTTAHGSSVWVVTLATGEVDVLPDTLATDLEWSPAGPQLAVASGENRQSSDGRLLDGSIRLYDADSGELRTLVDPSGVYFLAWSPDGTRIAYQRGPNSDSMGQQIWVTSVDGSGEYRLAGSFTGFYGAGPAWSPDGDRIVYQRAKTFGTEAHDIVLVTLDGGSEVVLPDVRLPGDPASVVWRPDVVTWSPDGTTLLFSGWSHGEQPRERRALISLPIDGSSDPVLIEVDVETGGQNRVWGTLPVVDR